MRDHKQLLRKVDELVQELHRQAEAQKKASCRDEKAGGSREGTGQLLRESRGLRKAAADLSRGLKRERT